MNPIITIALAYAGETAWFLIIILGSMLVPVTILDVNPGLGVGGAFQLAFIAAALGICFVTSYRRPLRARLILSAIVYPIATLISNVAFMLLIPGRFH